MTLPQKQAKSPQMALRISNGWMGLFLICIVVQVLGLSVVKNTNVEILMVMAAVYMFASFLWYLSGRPYVRLYDDHMVFFVRRVQVDFDSLYQQKEEVYGIVKGRKRSVLKRKDVHSADWKLLMARVADKPPA